MFKIKSIYASLRHGSIYLRYFKNFYNGRRKLIKIFNLVLNISIMQQYWNILQINFEKISQIMRDTFKITKLIIFEWFIYFLLFIRTNWLQPSFIFLNVNFFIIIISIQYKHTFIQTFSFPNQTVVPKEDWKINI